MRRVILYGLVGGVLIALLKGVRSGPERMARPGSLYNVTMTMERERP